MRFLLGFFSLLCGLTGASAEGVKLAWNPNPETDIAGYEVHYGTLSGQLTAIQDVGNTTTATLSDLEPGVTYYCAVLAYNIAGLKSQLSSEISFAAPERPIVLVSPGLLVKDDLGAPVGNGAVVNMGLVNLGAISDTRTFTVTNTSSDTLEGLALVLSGADVGSFTFSGDFEVASELEINGSFESGLASWSATGNVKASANHGASEGAQAAVFSAGNTANTGVLSRTFPTKPGLSYTLFYDVGVYSFNTSEQMLVTSITGEANLLTATAILKGDGAGGTIWSPRSLTFVADSETTTVVFSDRSTVSQSIDMVLDNVRMQAPQTAAGGTVISSLATGQTATCHVTFQPGSAGDREVLLSLTADPDSSVLFEMKLAGSGNALLEPWLASKGVIGGPSGNPDGDALNNLQEFAFGTDPVAAHGMPAAENGGSVISRGAPVARIITSPSFKFRGQFGRRKNHEAAGLIYRPQFSADLKTWVDATNLPEVHADDGEIEIVSVESPADISGQTPRFFRVGVDRKRPISLPGWLVQHGASGGMNGNPDGDSLDNLFEFAFGTDPAVAQGKSAAEVNGLLASRGAPAVRVNGNPGAPDFEFRGLFCRRKDRDSHGLIYRPQFSADLVTWLDATDAPQVRADDGEIEVVSVSAPDSMDGKTPRFFRVGLSQTDPVPDVEMIETLEMVILDSNANPDGDGLNNLLEFAFGTNPVIPQASQIEESNGWLVSRGAPAVRMTAVPSFEFQGLFGRRKDRCSHGLLYRPQFSADLSIWEDANDPPLVLTDDGEIEVVTVRAPTHINGETPRFFRVAVTREP